MEASKNSTNKVLALPLVLLLAACSSPVFERNSSTGFDSDPRNTYEFSYWQSTQNKECKVAVVDPSKSSRYEWNGTCRAGFANGCGLLVKEPGTVYRTEIRGCFSLGKKQGIVTETNYITGKTVVFTATFEQGIKQGYTKVSESELPAGEAERKADFDRRMAQADAQRHASGSIMDVQPIGVNSIGIKPNTLAIACPSTDLNVARMPANTEWLEDSARPPCSYYKAYSQCVIWISRANMMNQCPFAVYAWGKTGSDLGAIQPRATLRSGYDGNTPPPVYACVLHARSVHGFTSDSNTCYRDAYERDPTLRSGNTGTTR